MGCLRGPLLFLIYANDISNYIHKGQAILYVNDCTYLLPAENPDSSLDKVVRDLDQLSDWHKGNKLSLNHARTKAMIFHCGRSIRHRCGPIIIDGYMIEQLTHFKIPGLAFYTLLTCKEHIDMISVHLSSAVGILHKCSNILNHKWLMTLCSLFFMPFVN